MNINLNKYNLGKDIELHENNIANIPISCLENFILVAKDYSWAFINILFEELFLTKFNLLQKNGLVSIVKILIFWET